MTTVRSGTANSIRLRKTFTDGNGTLIREESPLPGGRTLSRAYSYDTQGRLTRVQRTGLADERTEYDSLGRVARRGLDVNGNGTLDPASSDRIVETAQFYEQNSGGWWEVSNSTTYLIPGNNTTTLLGSRKRRLGIGAGGLDVTTSADGQIFTISTNIDRTTGTTTVTTTANFSSQPAVSVYRYGRLIAQNSFTVANSSLYAYDALGRVTSVTDPRTGLATVITLNAVGQPLSVTRPDPDGGGPLQALVTRSGYYPATHPNAGELHWSEDGLGKRTYRAYNTRGQVTHQWGPATYPLRHLYDAFGEMTGLHTWRSGEPEAWSGETLPAAFSSEAPDATTWVYDQASGRLTQKKDAAGKGPIYAWSNAGQLQSRTWARGVVATYGYSATGDLTSTSYSDGTSGMTRTLRRDGSPATVTDAAGLTTYGYTGFTATSENITAQGVLSGLTLSYPQAQGRRQGFTATLGSDTVSSMSYGYDPRGRLANVAAPGIGAGGFSVEFGYVPNSDLPETTLSKVNSANVLTGTRGYDLADRLTSVSYSRPGNQVITSHGYILDAADRRTRAEREDGTAWVYGYNSRDEVTSAVKRLPGEELLAGWQQAFAYDNLGNRNWTREGGDANGANLRQIDYTPNTLNQYTEITRPGVVDVLGRAPTAVTVTVNEGAVSRQGEFWRKEIGDLPNSLAAVWQTVSVTAVDPGAGPNGDDLPARRSGHRFVPASPETPAYDLDGNLFSDSRWVYSWNGENQLIEVTTAVPALAAGVPRVRYRYVYDSRSRRIGRTVENWDADTQAWVVETNSQGQVIYCAYIFKFSQF